MPPQNVPFILTLDIGTSSTRAILFDASAQPVPNCIAQAPNYLETAVDGTAIFNARTLLDSVVASIDQLMAKLDAQQQAQIGAVTMATFVSNVLGANRAGDAVTPVFTYADTRNAPDAATLRSQLSKAEQSAAHDRTGCLIHTSYLPARFRWLEREHPQLLADADHWLSIGEYLLWTFLGERVVSYSVASWTGLLDRRLLEWDETWLGEIPLDATQLSRPVDTGLALKGLLPEWANRWPALKDVPWYPAIGDGAAANLGSGCGAIREDDDLRLAMTIGTTGAMRVVLDAEKATDAPVPDGLWFYRIDAKRGLLGGATTEGGNVYSWLRNTLKLPSSDVIEEALRTRPPAAHGLSVLPFVAGERAPGWDDDARASLLGFTLDTEPLDILQACQEAIAYRFALIYQKIASGYFMRLPRSSASGVALTSSDVKTEPVPQIIASGGALLGSPAWQQIVADTLGQPLTSLQEEEITARGLALLGLEMLGTIASVDERPPRFGETFIPDDKHHAIHQEALERQVDYYGRVQRGSI